MFHAKRRRTQHESRSAPRPHHHPRLRRSHCPHHHPHLCRSRCHHPRPHPHPHHHYCHLCRSRCHYGRLNYDDHPGCVHYHDHHCHVSIISPQMILRENVCNHDHHWTSRLVSNPVTETLLDSRNLYHPAWFALLFIQIYALPPATLKHHGNCSILNLDWWIFFVESACSSNSCICFGANKAWWDCGWHILSVFY